jgi:predicted TIM-barrel fold metal-dependent hydrolase
MEGNMSKRLFAGCLCCGPESTTILNRRGFLTGAAAIAGTAAFGGIDLVSKASAQAKPHRIDVHHHVAPPAWVEALKKAGKISPPVENWNVEKSLADMEKGGVATAMVSPTTPQVTFLGKEEAARVARECNEYSKKLMSDHPGKFGLFATLPLPHVDEALKEIAYAFDTLKADGIGMMTSYGDKWLGYPEFAPVWEELNKRKATVYTHPDGANCCVNLVKGLPETIVEFGADTTRSIGNLIFSGTAQRFPDINFIFSHGGGVLTASAERFQIQMVNTPPYKGKFTREDVDKQLQRFYYDTAQISNAVTIDALVKLVPVSQVVFGSDFPYRSSEEHVKGLAGKFNAADLKLIERDNALRILTRLREA